MTNVAEAMLASIRQGQAPSAQLLDRIASADGRAVGRRSAEALNEQLTQEVLGVGPLQPLLDDAAVTDILVNGTDGVWVDRGNGVERTNLTLNDPDVLRRLAVRLACLAGRRLDDASPCVDGLLPSGLRLHAVLPPLVEGAAHISLRVPSRTRWGLDDLCALGMCSAEDTRILRLLVRSRGAFMVSGGTGTGKSTLLAAMLCEVAPSERILLIEDVRELSVRHPHVVGLEARSANVEGRGEIPMSTLVRQALRMRPDRLVVGEVRGAEVRELLAALNTGHEGGCGTVHANSTADVVARFEALGALAGMSADAVRSQLASAVEAVVHLRRDPGRRVVAEIGVLDRDGAQLQVRSALVRTDGTLQPGPAYELLRERIGL